MAPSLDGQHVLVHPHRLWIIRWVRQSTYQRLELGWQPPQGIAMHGIRGGRRTC